MDVRTLTYFVTVAEELNITKAAKKLCMSQPPLSTQIRALEAELNTVLFIRGKRHLALTDSGKVLYRRAKEIIELTEEASAEILSMSTGIKGTISIGLVEGSAPIIASKWINDYIRKYPDVTFRIIDGNSDDLITKLRSGLISVAIVTCPYDATLLNSFSVGSERISAFMSRDCYLAKLPGNTISLSQLRDQPLIIPTRKALSDNIEKWFKEVGLEPRVVCQMDNYLDLAALAGSGVGIGLFPKTEYVSNPNLITKEIVDPERYLDYKFVWLKGHNLSSAYKAFIDMVKDEVNA